MVQAIAAALGWKPAARAAPVNPKTEDILAAAPPGLELSRGGIGMPAPIIDLDEMRSRNRERALEIARRGLKTG